MGFFAVQTAEKEGGRTGGNQIMAAKNNPLPQEAKT